MTMKWRNTHLHRICLSARCGSQWMCTLRQIRWTLVTEKMMVENMGMLRLEVHVDRIMPGEWGESKSLAKSFFCAVQYLCSPHLIASSEDHMWVFIPTGASNVETSEQEHVH